MSATLKSVLENEELFNGDNVILEYIANNEYSLEQKIQKYGRFKLFYRLFLKLDKSVGYVINVFNKNIYIKSVISFFPGQFYT